MSINHTFSPNKKYNDFDLRENRLMLSLGPLSPKKYCTYSCPFCYLHSNGFPSYHPMSISQIINWIRKQSEPFDIIYVSGDTDSFAPPRTAQGIKLLEALTEFDVDILFTTRTVFSDIHLNSLAKIQKIQTQNSKMLIGCVSISQLNQPHLEPKPIPSPLQRIEQLKRFKSIGITSILAMRPFLPVVPMKDYIQILNYVKDFIDVVLGSVWYADNEGILENNALKDAQMRSTTIEHVKLDFYSSDAIWKAYNNKEVEQEVRNFCISHKIPFFMRSGPAIKWLREFKLQMVSNEFCQRTNRTLGEDSQPLPTPGRGFTARVRHTNLES